MPANGPPDVHYSGVTHAPPPQSSTAGSALGERATGPDERDPGRSEWIELAELETLLRDVPLEALTDGPPPPADLLLLRTLRTIRALS